MPLALDCWPLATWFDLRATELCILPVWRGHFGLWACFNFEKEVFFFISLGHLKLLFTGPDDPLCLLTFWKFSDGCFSGNITRRIVWSIIIVVVMFIATVALAMLDSSNCKFGVIWLFYLRLQNLHQSFDILQYELKRIYFSYEEFYHKKSYQF